MLFAASSNLLAHPGSGSFWAYSPGGECQSSKSTHGAGNCLKGLPHYVSCPPAIGSNASYQSHYHVTLEDSGRNPHHRWYSLTEASIECRRRVVIIQRSPCTGGQTMDENGECGCGDSEILHGGVCLACPTNSSPNSTGDNCECDIAGQVPMGTLGDEDDPPRCAAPCFEPPYVTPTNSERPKPTEKERLSKKNVLGWAWVPPYSTLGCRKMGCSAKYRTEGEFDKSPESFIEVVTWLKPDSFTPKTAPDCRATKRTENNIMATTKHELKHADAFLRLYDRIETPLYLQREFEDADSCEVRVKELTDKLAMAFSHELQRQHSHTSFIGDTVPKVKCIGGQLVEVRN